MKVVQRYSVNGYYQHQTVDSVGKDLEIQEYGEGEEDGKRGVFGVVHPSLHNGTQGVTKNVLVIRIDGKWIPTTQEPD